MRMLNKPAKWDISSDQLKYVVTKGKQIWKFEKILKNFLKLKILEHFLENCATVIPGNENVL